MLVSACGLGAQYPHFTAKQYRLEGTRTLPGTDLSGPATFYRDDERLRYEGILESHGIATVVYDPLRKTAYLLDSSASRRRLFAGETPQRLAMQLSEADTPQPLEVTWAALGAENVRSFGRCRVAGERGNLWRPRDPIAPDVERTACITPDGIVLRLTENDAVLFEATSVERGPQAASLFEIPEAYRIISNAELAQLEDEAVGANAASAATPQTRTPR
ncbi:MAG TPA: hypothetical protein VEF55_08640 [Candidatus Binatia bacterium]|nr:hypothetical protein [Candidatus Binatia bacterium]